MDHALAMPTPHTPHPGAWPARACRRGKGAEWMVYGSAMMLMGFVLAPADTSAGTDGRSWAVESELARARDAIELFRRATEAGAYPDLCVTGWAPLIEAGYLAGEPVNPITGRSGVGREAKAGYGWHYDATTGALGACYFDEGAGRMTEAP